MCAILPPTTGYSQQSPTGDLIASRTFDRNQRGLRSPSVGAWLRGSTPFSSLAFARNSPSSPTVIFESGLIVRFGPPMKNHRQKRDQKSSPFNASNSVRNSTMLFFVGTSRPFSFNLRPPNASASSGTHAGSGDSKSTATSHTRAVLSQEAVTIRRPSALKLAASTGRLWRNGSPTGLPLCASHTRAVLSLEAVTIRRPSALKLAAVTPSSWRSGWPTGLPVSVSHTRAVLSWEAVTTRRPSGLKLAAITSPSWRSDSPTCLPLCASH